MHRDDYNADMLTGESVADIRPDLALAAGGPDHCHELSV